MSSFQHSHETVIDAPPAVIHPLINDFRQWRDWSPWEEVDADLERNYSGADQGVGAEYAWQGKKSGSGSMEITESTPERIGIDLEFLKPFKASNKILFELRGSGDSTRVVWTMSGERNLLMTVAGKLFFDKAIGKDFDKGLAKLKKRAEKG